VDFDHAAFEAANVANIFKIRGEDDYRERARGLLFAEADEVNALGAGFYVQNFSGDAFVFADVLGGFANGEAIGGEERG
jgi:hypothetical protein